MRGAPRIGRIRAACAAAVLALAAPPAGAVETRSAALDAAELMRGDADGVAITARGSLLPAPRLARLGPGTDPERPAQVWSALPDGAGGLFLGTGPDGAILKVSPSGESRLLFRTGAPLVTALAILAGGDLLAGTSPGGSIYRVRPDGTGSVWCETGERYVWALAALPDGTVFAGTGDRGIVLKIGAAGSAESFFDSDEAHILSLAPLRGGGLLAGSAGRGLVFRIHPGGRAEVLHDDELPEIRAVAPAPGGEIYAAALGEPETEPRPPAVRIRVAGGEEVGAAPDLAPAEEDRRGQVLEGIIEGLPPAAEEAGRRLRGRVVRIAPDGTASEIWRSTTEAPYCLFVDRKGRAVFGVGEPGRLYRAEAADEVALLATLAEGQVTAVTESGRDLAVATSNPAAAYRLDRETASPGVFVSPPFDAGALSRWGAVRWRVEGPPGRIEIFTRTGNTAEPDETWSAWSPAMTDPDSSRVPNPDGRFVQWRARVAGNEDAGVRISGVTIHYAPYNRPPAVRGLVLDAPRPSVAAKAAFRFEASDEDGDPVDVEVRYRAVGASSWAAAARLDALPTTASFPGGSGREWKAGKVAWETAAVAEGAYDVRAVASDRAVNPAGEGLEGTCDLAFRVTVDRSPPILEAARGADDAIEILVRDTLSPVSRVEVLRNGRPAFLARPTDGVCDSPEESFRIAPGDLEAAGALESATLRALDDAGNVAERPIPAR